MRSLVLIPARGGSKGIPKKNIKLLNGKPLIQYTIDAARSIFEDSDICVSTDSEEIRNVVEQNGLEVPFMRPAELATDTMGTYQVLLHAITFFEARDKYYDSLILLQPTSPFRTSEHIKSALDIYNSNLDMVVSVVNSDSNPYYNLFEENTDGFLNISKEGDFNRRQDCPNSWKYNGAIYIINIASLKSHNISKFSKKKKFEMSARTSIDLDTIDDWNYAEYILQNYTLR